MTLCPYIRVSRSSQIGPKGGPLILRSQLCKAQTDIVIIGTTFFYNTKICRPEDLREACFSIRQNKSVLFNLSKCTFILNKLEKGGMKTLLYDY